MLGFHQQLFELFAAPNQVKNDASDNTPIDLRADLAQFYYRVAELSGAIFLVAQLARLRRVHKRIAHALCG